MKRLVSAAVAVGLLLSVAAGTAGAQLAGSVVHNGSVGPGVRLAGDYTRGLNDESGKTNFVGARAALGLPGFSVWGGVGVVTNGGSNVTLGGGAAIKLITGPLIPVEVSLQGGLGFLSDDGNKTTNIPLGVAVAVDVPTPGVSIRPWVMPRLLVLRFAPDMGETNTEIGFGAAAGVMVTFPTGIGAHATLDWTTIDNPLDPIANIQPTLLNVGLHYNLSVPSLGMM